MSSEYTRSRPRGQAAALLLVGTVVATAASAGLLPSMDQQPMKAWAMTYGVAGPKAPPAELFGLVQPGYAYIQNDVGTTKVGNGAFKFYRLRPGIRGSIGPDIDYYFLAEFANNAANPTGTAHVLDGSVTLNDLPGVHVQIGEMLVPFGDEGITAAPVLPWINYSPGTLNIDYNEFTQPPNGGVFNAGGELGVLAFNQVRSGNAAFDYAVGLFNGTGVSQTESSTKRPQDVLAHVGGGVGALTAAVGFERGTQAIGTAPAPSYRQTKYAIDLHYGNYIRDPLWLWYEYEHARDEQAVGNGLARGWFAAGGMRPARNVMAVLRYSRYNAENLLPVSCTTSALLSCSFGAPAGNVSENVDSAIAILLGQKGVRYYLEYDRTTFNNSPAPADSAVSFMASLPFGARLLH